MVVVVLTLGAISCVEAEKAELKAVAEPVKEAVTEPVEEAVTEPVKEVAAEPVEEAAAEPVKEVEAEVIEETAPAKVVEVLPENAEVAEKSTDLATVQQQVGYSIGSQIGGDFRRNEFDIDADAFAKGFKDAFSGKELLLNEKEIEDVLDAFKQRLQEAQKEKIEKQAAAGKAFLEENKTKEGVVVLPSGLQYKVIKEGTGATPKATDTVKTNYRGTLIDGTEFDSSDKHGEPATFLVTHVVPGWTEALQLMKVGAKWELYIPSELGYGARGSRTIPPNAALIFEIELLDILPPKPVAPPKAPKPVAPPKPAAPPKVNSGTTPN